MPALVENDRQRAKTSDNISALFLGNALELSRPRFITRPFVYSAAVLAVAAVLAGPVASLLNFRQSKEPLPLRAALGNLNAEALRPYRVVARQVLDPGIVDALDTDQYLSWTVEDTSAPENSPLRHAFLFVTYYTGAQNLVPHTPDVCYLGSGYEAAEPHTNEDLQIHAASPDDRVPVRICTFAKTAVFNRTEFTVVYTFFANGQFANTRNQVRVLLNDLRNRHAFFSKVEASFPGASRLESIEGARKLFGVVLPVLIQEHWPDFQAAEAQADSKQVQSAN